MDNNVGPCFLVEAHDGIAVTQIVLLGTRHKYILTAARAEFLDDIGSEKARTAGDQHTFIGPERHGCLVLA